MHPQTLTARALATLAQAAQAQGFDTRTHAGRARLAAFAGMPQAQLDAPFVKGDADLVFVIEMARVLAVPLHQLLDESRRHFQFLPLYPYLGGDPLHLSLPSAWIRQLDLASLFYVEIAGSDFETGLPPHSVVVLTRQLDRIQVGRAYFLDGEAGAAFRRCTALNADGSVVWGAFGDGDVGRTALPSRRTDTPATPALAADLTDTLVIADTLWLGRVLGTFRPD